MLSFQEVAGEDAHLQDELPRAAAQGPIMQAAYYIHSGVGQAKFG